MKFETVPLSTVCTQDRTSVRAGDRSELRYLGMESIEPQSGALAKGELSKTPDAPEANSFLFTQAHVLYGKLRPYLNKVHIPTFDGKCSTELVPLCPSKELHREFLAYFLRAPSTVEKISQRVAGARMPRADMNFVMSLPIPLPPQDEQRRIVDLLSRAENIARMRREAEAKAKEIVPALFLDMFGDPAINPKGWEVASLGSLLTDGPKNGLYKHATLYGDGTPILRIDSFYDGAVDDIGNLRRVRISEQEKRAFALRAGDIVINRVNSPEYLGKSAIVPTLDEPTVFESNMMRLRVNVDLVRPDYLIQLLQQPSMRRALIINAKHAINQSSINQTDVRNLALMVPPLALQEGFVARAAALLGLANRQVEAVVLARAAFQSLLAGVFGEGA